MLISKAYLAQLKFVFLEVWVKLVQKNC